MEKKTLTGLQNSGTVEQLRQVLSNLQVLSSSEDDPTCQDHGEGITQADSVTLYFSRSAGQYGCNNQPTGGRK
jgi:hypothetical protein